MSALPLVEYGVALTITRWKLRFRTRSFSEGPGFIEVVRSVQVHPARARVGQLRAVHHPQWSVASLPNRTGAFLDRR